MKVKIPDPLIIINLAVAILVFSVFNVHSVVIQVIFGIPFVLYFPGYVTVRLLFAHKRIENLEHFALSSGTSVALMGLIGFLLNFTDWGITSNSVVIATGIFIYMLSILILFKQSRTESRAGFIREFHFTPKSWNVNKNINITTVVLSVLILGAIGFLAFAIALNNNTEKFSEMYLLGHDNKAENYPTLFLMQNGEITGVKYGTAPDISNEKLGQVTIGVINHEGTSVTYRLTVLIDGIPIDAFYNNQLVTDTTFSLPPEGEWEEQIGFAPLHPGVGQMVEFSLFDATTEQVIDSVHLYVDVNIE